MIKNKIRFGLSAGSIPLGAALKLVGRNNIQFDDDPERSKSIFLEKLTADMIYTPPIIAETKKITNFNALKEWAYLSPKYFKPNKDALEAINVKPKEYIFAREVSTGSLNYTNQMPGVILSFADQIPKNVKVVLSLEDKSLTKFYPKHWIILKEPVSDIHSLIYYSFALISSGDSMAREGAELGVPSVYCGFRDMKANKILAKEGMLFEKQPNDVALFIKDVVNQKLKIKNQDAFRTALEHKWDDITELIISKVTSNEK